MSNEKYQGGKVFDHRLVLLLKQNTYLFMKMAHVFKLLFHLINI